MQRLRQRSWGQRRYRTAAQLQRLSRRLAKREGFSTTEVGQAGGGERLSLLQFGPPADHRVLVWGFEDPNEPLCSLTMPWLCQQLSRRASPLRDLDCQWGFLFCLDPAGARRNEHWFRRPGRIREYLRGVWQPTNHASLFWAGDEPQPEVQALRTAIARYHPTILCDLHDESHFISEGYHVYIFGIDSPPASEFADHMAWLKHNDVPIAENVFREEPLEQAASFSPAFSDGNRVIAAIPEVPGYRAEGWDGTRFKPGPESADSFRPVLGRLEVALAEYVVALEQIRAGQPDECTDSGIYYARHVQKQLGKENGHPQPMDLLASGCGLRSLHRQGRSRQARRIEQAMWSYIRAVLALIRYEPIPLRVQRAAQADFLLSLLLAAGVRSHSGTDPATIRTECRLAM